MSDVLSRRTFLKLAVQATLGDVGVDMQVKRRHA